MGNLCSSGTKSEATGKGKSNAKAAILHPKEPTHKAMRLLGKGTAATTWLFEDHELSRPVAIKVFTRPIRDFPPEAVQREVLVQTELGPGHINLINVYTLFLTADCLGIVMEWGEGGSMTEMLERRIKSKKSESDLMMSEDEALYLFRQLISAVAYCHAHGIAHRDLKLDNTLLDGSNPPVIKVCDFGFAKHFDGPAEICQSHLGTPEYMSPELLHKSGGGKQENYDARRSDVWAAGVILIVCLCGAFPFDTADHPGSQDAEADLWREETDGNWKDSPHIAKNVKALSPEVVDLLDHIFLVRPEDRIDVAGIMKHPWYNRPLEARYQSAMEDLQQHQRGLEAHTSKQHYDKAKVAGRSEAIRNLVNKAIQPEQNNIGTPSIQLKENSAFNIKSPHIEQIDLGERSILAGDERTDSEAQIVRERFDRVSVSKAVQNAFEGDKNKDLHDAAERSREFKPQ